MTVKKLIQKSILILPFFLSACSFIPSAPPTQTDSIATGQTTLQDVLQARSLLAVTQNNQLLLIDPEFPSPVPVYTFKAEETPPNQELFSFKVSPTKKYVVWYTPNRGFMNLNLQTTDAKSIFSPNDWLNQNPFFTYKSSEDRISFINNQGTEFITIDLETDRVDRIKIPHPFGNLFTLSPDNQKILFISGFSQIDTKPQFMITNADGANAQRFTTNTQLISRDMLVWLADSSGVIIVENQNQLVFIPANQPQDRRTYMEFNEAEQITDLHRVGDAIYVLIDNSTWHIIDSQTKQEVGRVPVEIAQELFRPVFFPWEDQQFLIEETLRPQDTQFRRLWLSDPTGVKKVIIEKYHETKLTSDTPAI